MNFKIFLAPVVIVVLTIFNVQAECLTLNGHFREKEFVSGHVTNGIRTIQSDCTFINYKMDDLDLHLTLGQVQTVSHANGAYSEFRMQNFYFDGMVIQQTYFYRQTKKFLFEMRFIKKENGQLFVIRTRLDYPDKISSAVTELNPVDI